jgi:transcriptional regulator with XRE-family HTH domain
MGDVIRLYPADDAQRDETVGRRKRLGTMIRRARGDLRQAALAGRLGVGQSTISAWENGAVALGVEQLFMLEDTLGLVNGWLSVAGGYADPELDPLLVLLEASVPRTR